MTVLHSPLLRGRESELLASVPTGLLINGQWRPAASGKTFDVEDPATGKVLLSICRRRCRRRRRRPGRRCCRPG